MALAQHGPGWRLPRPTVLARRYHVSTAEIDAAISELAGRGLARRLPDGQVHRVSPAEYLIPLECAPCLRSRTDPMAGELTCRSRQASWRRVAGDICWALRVDPAQQVHVVRAVWAAGGEPAAYVTSYLPAGIARAFPDTAPPGAAEADEPASADRASGSAGVPAAGETSEPAGATAPPGDPLPRPLASVRHPRDPALTGRRFPQRLAYRARFR